MALQFLNATYCFVEALHTPFSRFYGHIAIPNSNRHIIATTMLDENSNPNDNKMEDCEVYSETYKPPFLALLVIVFPIMPLFWSYSVRVTKDHLTFGYSNPIVAKTVERSDVREAIPIATVNGLWEWGGWGIRYRKAPPPPPAAIVQEKDEQTNLSSWETGYIVTNGGAVKVILNDDKKSIYYFSCNNPQHVCEILNGKR
jgi:hypothetical protein